MVGRCLVPALLAGATMISAGCTATREDRDEPARQQSFTTVMTFAVPATTHDIRSALCRYRERHTRWLRFTGDEPTMTRVRNLGGGSSKPIGFAYLHGSHRPGGHDGTDPEAPLWWNHADAPLEMEQITLSQLQEGKTAVATDIWIDEKKRTVFARRVELDLTP